MPRACVIVLDAVGAGALPDADQYGDEGSDTLGNVARAVGGLDLPNLEALGLGNVEPLEGCPPQPGRLGYRDHPGARRGTPADGEVDRLHLGRLGLPGRRARGDDPGRGALRGLP